MSQRLQEAVDEFQGLAQAVVTASQARHDQTVGFPEGFEFIKVLPEAEIQALKTEVKDLSNEIKSKLGGVYGMQPLLAYNMAIRRLKNKLGAYELVSVLHEKDEHGS